MQDLLNKIEELRKSLAAMKPKENSLVPALSMPTIKPISIQSSGAGVKTELPGVAPASGKDPKKMAEQLKNPRPKKPKIEMLKFDKNGQWSLNKAHDNYDSPEYHKAMNNTWGFITPKGEYISNEAYGKKHGLDSYHHGDVLHHMEKQGAVDPKTSWYDKAKQGWMQIGSGGGAPHLNVHPDIAKNRMHPAMVTARKMAQEHWTPVVNSFEMSHPTPDSFGDSVKNFSSHSFGKNGVLKPVT